MRNSFPEFVWRDLILQLSSFLGIIVCRMKKKTKNIPNYLTPNKKKWLKKNLLVIHQVRFIQLWYDHYFFYLSPLKFTLFWKGLTFLLNFFTTLLWKFPEKLLDQTWFQHLSCNSHHLHAFPFEYISLASSYFFWDFVIL